MLQARMTQIMESPRLGIIIARSRMQGLEIIAAEAIGFITPNMLLNFTDKVERYYLVAVRMENLVEIP